MADETAKDEPKKAPAKAPAKAAKEEPEVAKTDAEFLADMDGNYAGISPDYARPNPASTARQTFEASGD